MDLYDFQSSMYEHQKRQFSKRHITKNFASINLNRVQKLLTIHVREALNKTVVRSIAVDCYLKLGINRIKYCIYDNTSYNLLIRPFDINMIAVAEKTQGIASSVTIEELANKIDMSVIDIRNLLEESQIPVIFRNGELSISRNSAHSLISNIFNQKRDSCLAGIFHDEEDTQFVLEETSSSTEQSTISEDGYDSQMQLPSSFDIMEGYKRRPTILAGLRIAIESLPQGKTPEGFNYYLSELISKSVAGKKFLEKLVPMFPGKKPESAHKELLDSVIKLWQESEG